MKSRVGGRGGDGLKEYGKEQEEKDIW